MTAMLWSADTIELRERVEKFVFEQRKEIETK
jgi:hypothetical protein